MEFGDGNLPRGEYGYFLELNILEVEWVLKEYRYFQEISILPHGRGEMVTIYSKYSYWYFGIVPKEFCPKHGCHKSGNGQGKKKFFKVREMSGNFILGQGKLEF